MKKLTENEFEEIFNKIKDVRVLDFSSIKGFDDFNEEDQTRIIHEWTVYGSESYKIDLAEGIIKDNDDEPYTDARIARKLNITISLAKIIKDYVLGIEDGSIVVPSHREKCIKELRRLLSPVLNDEKVEPERIRLLKEELDGICEKGDPERMLMASIIARTFRVTKNYYEARGNITSSLVAYHLRIHNVACFKHKIDYRLCHGDDFKKAYSLVFRVSQDKQPDLYKMVESILKDNDNFCFGKICSEPNKSGNQFIFSYKMFISKTKNILNKCRVLTDHNETQYQCITKSEADKFGLDQIQIRIEGRWTASFLKTMNELHPFGLLQSELENTNYLNKLLKNNAKTPFNAYHYDYLKNKFNEKGSLSFDDFVECISYHIDCIEDSGADYVYSKMHKGEIISICYNLLKICYYLVEHTDESAKAYAMTKFISSEIKNNVITNKAKHELDEHALFLNEYHSKFQKRFIGIFFFIDGKLRVYKEELSIDEDKEFIDVEMGHYELFNSFNMPVECEYSMYPRGRVLYNVKDHMFYLYADKTILKSKTKIDLIKKEFLFPLYNVLLKSDEHYKTLKY